ncbi:hypothetical protein BVRB_9g217070 [Beta vulgaris subsp. vulgaris]|uniref:protein CASPARIAN STRIP INTEGRITY FACTOR 1 isoform X1 n=1 Tax=Beta vulgaris subsp. vulgaris TaxID=3555 RepID=UPI00053F5510|nr:protein CASPARIAN STRIP INTEGRITY FACTOR 1 isoform X1 [Beta vulgaris subsp. vulgaris]KMT00403.1 hypothetical protein BVRB_9g217070 [Beta vulgaris subsp. vulgaris]
MNMASLPLTKLVLLFIIISASLISTSYAGRFLTKSLADEEFVGTYEASAVEGDNKEENIVHERMLRWMNTHDYGRYDPAPSFRRPRHKLIPN